MKIKKDENNNENQKLESFNKIKGSSLGERIQKELSENSENIEKHQNWNIPRDPSLGELVFKKALRKK